MNLRTKLWTWPIMIVMLGGLVFNSAFSIGASSRSNQSEPTTAAWFDTSTSLPFPITPPDASKISIGAVDPNGIALVTGSAGAVPPHAAVALVNLSSTNAITTTASATGTFSASLFAPPGSTLLVKYELNGERIEQFWKDVYLLSPPDMSYMNPLPGTIIPIGTLPADDSLEQAYHAAGYYADGSGWLGFWMNGAVAGPAGGDLQVGPGDEVDLSAHIYLNSPNWNCSNPTSYNPMVNVHLRYQFDAAGHSHPSGIWFASHLFTPTGLPIEREGFGEVVGVVSEPFTGLSCHSNHTLSGQLTTSFTVPASLPEGTYQIELHLTDGALAYTPGLPRAVVWYHDRARAALPSLTLGEPAAPQIPWTLFGNEPVNGYRGVGALEDAGQYAMPVRTLHVPHLIVLPRYDARSGETISYRLEPGSHWLSATDRRVPNPPKIPLAFPAGELSATIHKPDASIEIIGPVPLLQSSVRTPTTPGGAPLDHGTGHIGDLFHLYTGDPAFAYQFDQDGIYLITLDGEVRDIFGESYPIRGTYEFMVARVLDLDPAQLPTTPYEVGDAFAPGLHIFPPLPAQIEIRLVQLPNSNPEAASETVISGTANRFGYFQPPPGTAIHLEAPGEFRVDITATYQSPDGNLWAGTMTWGNVIEGPHARIAAHGRRGMDYHADTIADMPAWFKVRELPLDKVGIEVYYPYFRGDIHWGTEDDAPGDSIHSIITIEDLDGINTPIYTILRNNYPNGQGGFRWPPDDTSLAGLDKRLAVGEAPLFSSTYSGIDAGVAPDDIEQFAYAYTSSERPDVRVREMISEDNIGTAYWRFDDTYGYQIGEPADGDKPGDIKWEFGGAVFRVPDQEINEYAIYASLWVLLPHGDPVGARISPPFQNDDGQSFNGGPILELLGQEIDVLFLPKGVRPGDVLETGDTISFSGHVGPPLDSRVEVSITAPGGAMYSRVWHANKVGWLYDPTFDFPANEPGRWTVHVFVEHDRSYPPNHLPPTSHNTGTVLGTSGQYSFYVVEPGSLPLLISSPKPGFITWPQGKIEPIEIRGCAPAGSTAVHYTIHDKGIVMGQGSLVPDASGCFVLVYDAEALHVDFPMLSLVAREGLWEGLADEVAINFLATGAAPQANTVTLIGEEVFIGSPAFEVMTPILLK